MKTPELPTVSHPAAPPASRCPSPWATGAAVLAALLLVLLAVDVSTGQDPDRWELLLTRHATAWRPPLFEWAMSHVDDLAEVGVLLILLILSAIDLLRGREHRWRDLATLWGFVLGSALFVHIAKAIVDRTRPGLILGAGDTDSFPSGHTMAAAAALLFLIYRVIRSGLPAPLKCVLAASCAGALCAVAYSRVYVGAHYPTDVVASILAAGIGLQTCLALRRRFDH